MYGGSNGGAKPLVNGFVPSGLRDSSVSPMSGTAAVHVVNGSAPSPRLQGPASSGFHSGAGLMSAPAISAMAGGGGTGGFVLPDVSGDPTPVASRGATVSYMSPIFHFAAHDTTIVAMEHNNHCKLLAIATSRNEIYVTVTQFTPVIENMGVESANEDPFAAQHAPPMDERLLDWDPAAASVLVDRLRFPISQILWAPWQHGVYLAGVCPGRCVTLYHYSHGRWALEESIPTPGAVSCAFSVHFILACASGDRVVLLSRRAVASAEEDCMWVVASSLGGEQAGSQHPPQEPPSLATSMATGGFKSRPRETQQQQQGHKTRHNYTCVGFDESGTLLAVGEQGGDVSVFAVATNGAGIGNVVATISEGGSATTTAAMAASSTTSSGPGGSPGNVGGSCDCLQVIWSPLAGRSYLILATVFENRVVLHLFQRPRHMGLVKIVTSAQRTRRSKAHIETLVPLQTVSVECEDIAKLSWNTTGTRFVTSHLDSSVHIWAIDAIYQKSAVIGDGGLSALPQSAGASSRTPGAGSGAGAIQPVLKVSVRRVSSVHPYHAVNMK